MPGTSSPVGIPSSVAPPPPVSRLSLAGGHGGRLVSIPIAAEQTTIITATGTKAYFVIATGVVNMRSDTNDFSLYSQGTGLDQVNKFTSLTLNNPNIFPIVVSIWVGFDGYIDNRLILANATIPNVTYPTQAIVGATQILIPDISGNAFLDINGSKWLALYRLSIIISNLDISVALLLQHYNSTVSNGPAVLLCPAGLPVEHLSGGNFSISNGGGPINAIVSEIYSAIATG